MSSEAQEVSEVVLKDKAKTSPRKGRKSRKTTSPKKRTIKQSQTTSPKSKNSPSTPTPETTKSNSPKQNTSTSTPRRRSPSPKRGSPGFARIASPTKATKELSEATPIQLFQRQFLEFTTHITKLRQIGPPIGSEKFFMKCHICQEEIQSFEYHFNKLMKQKVLNAPLNSHSLEVCRVLQESFPIFIASIGKYHSKIPLLYQRSMLAYIHTMQDNFECFCGVCTGDPVTRNIIQQYEGICRSTLRKIEASIQSLFDPKVYSTISSEEALALSESVKTFGRFFVIDLQRIIWPYISFVPKIAEFYGAFRASFLELVPLISAIPNYRDEFEEVEAQVPPLKSAFEKLMALVGTVKTYTTSKVKTSVTQHPELALQKIDPLEEPMRQFSAFLECEFDEKAKRVARFETLRKTAEERITALKVELEQAKERIELLEKEKTKEEIEGRFEQIRSLRDEMSKHDQLKREKFVQELIVQLKPLTGQRSFLAEGDSSKQLRSLVQSVSQKVSAKDVEIQLLKDEIERAKEAFGGCADGETLLDLAKSFNEKSKMKGEASETLEKIRSKMKLKEDDDLLDEVKKMRKKLKEQKKKKKKLKEELSKKKKSKSKLKDEALGVLREIYKKVSDPSDETKPPKDVSKLKDAIIERMDARKDALSSFITKLQKELGLNESENEETAISQILAKLHTNNPEAVVMEEIEMSSSSDDAF